MRKNKKAQTIKTIIMLIVGLVVVGMLIYLGYKYILGTGESVGQLGTCSGQGGRCVSGQCESGEKRFFGLGCPETEQDKSQNNRYCCIPQARVS